MTRSTIENIALRAQPLTDSFKKNVRYFIPAALIPVTPGSALARKAGLIKYGGQDRGLGFVIQSSDLIGTLERIFAALDVGAPSAAPHAIRSDGPLCIPVALPGMQYDHLVEVFRLNAPSLIDSTEITTILRIPTDIPTPERDRAIMLLMIFPLLREATVRRLGHETPNQYFGLEYLIRRDDHVQESVEPECDRAHDHNLIASFLSREEPFRR